MFGRRFFGGRYFAPRYFGDGGDAAESEEAIGAAGSNNYHGLARDYHERYLKKKREEEEEVRKLEELRQEVEQIAEAEQPTEAPPIKKKRETLTLKKRVEEPDYSAEIARAKQRIDRQIAAIEEAERQRDIAETAYLIELARQAEEQRMLADEEDAIFLLLM